MRYPTVDRSNGEMGGWAPPSVCEESGLAQASEHVGSGFDCYFLAV